LRTMVSEGSPTTRSCWRSCEAAPPGVREDGSPLLIAAAARRSWLAVLACGLLLSTCRGRGGLQGPPSGPDEADLLSQELERLLSEAGDLVRVDGCATSEECAVAAIGAKPCGGPRTYWVCCRATTNEAALASKLEEARRVEARLNEHIGAGSDCLFATPPDSAAIDGVCGIVAVQ
jgi:hypothetical protein